eukprot:s1302_g3.t1
MEDRSDLDAAHAAPEPMGQGAAPAAASAEEPFSEIPKPSTPLADSSRLYPNAPELRNIPSITILRPLQFKAWTDGLAALEEPLETKVQLPAGAPAPKGALFRCNACNESVYESQLDYHVAFCLPVRPAIIGLVVVGEAEKQKKWAKQEKKLMKAKEMYEEEQQQSEFDRLLAEETQLALQNALESSRHHILMRLCQTRKVLAEAWAAPRARVLSMLLLQDTVQAVPVEAVSELEEQFSRARLTQGGRPVREFLHSSGAHSSDFSSSNSVSGCSRCSDASSNAEAVESSALAMWNGATESKGELSSEGTVGEVTDTTGTGPAASEAVLGMSSGQSGTGNSDSSGVNDCARVSDGSQSGSASSDFRFGGVPGLELESDCSSVSSRDDVAKSASPSQISHASLLAHVNGTCKPCGCKLGTACQFCHLCTRERARADRLRVKYEDRRAKRRACSRQAAEAALAGGLKPRSTWPRAPRASDERGALRLSRESGDAGRQHASWLSEAEVLGLGEHFSEAPRLIADAWLKLQLKKRWHEIGEGPFPLSDSFASTFAR